MTYWKKHGVTTLYYLFFCIWIALGIYCFQSNLDLFYDYLVQHGFKDFLFEDKIYRLLEALIPLMLSYVLLIALLYCGTGATNGVFNTVKRTLFHITKVFGIFGYIQWAFFILGGKEPSDIVCWLEFTMYVVAAIILIDTIVRNRKAIQRKWHHFLQGWGRKSENTLQKDIGKTVFVNRHFSVGDHICLERRPAANWKVIVAKKEYQDGQLKEVYNLCSINDFGVEGAEWFESLDQLREAYLPFIQRYVPMRDYVSVGTNDRSKQND
ncbi:hypothetical protein [Listeria booriae]|uniref:Uncharacterized protein n=1 Tax=Listeria booriae TaxID=1552123 RepID=A0A7X0XMQ9_9LIST|nr:hypothetical protein [Listeria booriae]MBC1563603.1 hypothetical protein [Listeria booriae]